MEAKVTELLKYAEAGDSGASERLLPLVYAELRRLAAVRLAQERPGITLQPTSLVHEAYLRLVGGSEPPRWDNRGHFFAAAAEAMRRILIDEARKRLAAKRGGGGKRQTLPLEQVAAPEASDDLLALNEALDKLAGTNLVVSELVKLRYFAGLTNRQAAACLKISARTADNYWAYAKAFLLREIETTV